MLKRCSTTVLVFLLFYFYGGLIFFPPPFSALLAFVYILFTAPFSRSSAGSALFSPQEFYDPPTGRWDTRLRSGAGNDGGTGETQRPSKTCWQLCLFLKDVSKSHRLTVGSNIPALSSCLGWKKHSCVCLFGEKWKQGAGLVQTE